MGHFGPTVDPFALGHEFFEQTHTVRVVVEAFSSWAVATYIEAFTPVMSRIQIVTAATVRILILRGSAV